MTTFPPHLPSPITDSSRDTFKGEKKTFKGEKKPQKKTFKEEKKKQKKHFRRIFR